MHCSEDLYGRFCSPSQDVARVFPPSLSAEDRVLLPWVRACLTDDTLFWCVIAHITLGEDRSRGRVNSTHATSDSRLAAGAARLRMV